MKSRKIMFSIGVYGICALVIFIGGMIITAFNAEENYWLIYPLILVFVWPIYLSVSKKANLLSRNDVKNNAYFALKWNVITCFILVCGGLSLGYFEIVQVNKIKEFLVLFSIVMLNNALGEYFAYLFWKPKSTIALSNCMKLYLQAKDGSRAKARWQKLLLKNFDTIDGPTIYNNPYTWRAVIDKAILLFGKNEIKVDEIDKLFLDIELSASEMSELAAIVREGDEDKEYWDEEDRLTKPLQKKTLVILRNKVNHYFARQ